MGLLKTRRPAAMQKQQRTKAGMKPPTQRYSRMGKRSRKDKKEFIRSLALLLATFTWLAIEWPAYALPAVRPVLPPIEFADTETVTNVAFTAWERGLREFRFDLAFTGTASNNVEMAFGTDADGNGALSDGEVSVLAGWDCGELFIANNATDERFTEASTENAPAPEASGCPSVEGASPEGRKGPRVHVFSCVCEMRSNGRVVNVACSNDSSTVFLDLAAAKPAWLHSLDWNMVRLTGRGENVRVGERFSAKITPSGFFFRLR